MMVRLTITRRDYKLIKYEMRNNEKMKGGISSLKIRSAKKILEYFIERE